MAGNMTDDSRDEHLAYVEITVQVIILIIALLGNTFVLVALFRHSRNKPLSRVYLLMAHLSVADLLVALLNILPQLAWDITFRFRGGDSLCRIVKYLQVFVLYLSTYIIVAMALDRYLAVRNIAGKFSPIRVLNAMILGAWLVAALLALPQAFIFGLREIKEGVSDCWATFVEPWGTKSYVSWFVLSIFGFPITIIGFCYGLICSKVWKYDQRSIRIIKPEVEKVKVKRRGPMNRAKMKTLKLTLTVVICFFVCWSPFCIAQLCMAFNPPAAGQDVGPLQTILLLLASLNSCTNPWIYLLFSGSLVNQLRLLCGLGTGRAMDNDSVGDDDPPPAAHNRKNCAPMPLLLPTSSQPPAQRLSTDHTDCL